MVHFAIEQNTTTRETIIFNHTPPMNVEMGTNDPESRKNVLQQAPFAGGTFGAKPEAAPTAKGEVRSPPMRTALPRSVPALGDGGSGAGARGGFVCTLGARTHRTHPRTRPRAERAHPPKFHKITNGSGRNFILLFYWRAL